MDQNTILLDFAMFVNKMKFPDSVIYNEDLLIIDLNVIGKPERHNESLPSRLDAHSFFLCTDGTLEITIDYAPYTIHRNTLCILTQNHIVNDFRFSDYKGYHVVIAHDYFHKIVVGELPPPEGFSPHDNPVFEFNESDFDILVSYVKLLRKDINRKEHYYQAKLIDNILANFIYEIWYLSSKGSSIRSLKEQYDKSKVLTSRFFELLITNCLSNHQVSFYADKLNVSPVYLSRTVKKITGKTAIRLISDFIIIEAKTKLRNPNNTIMEISDYLNFADQSSFSKFFKKYIGESPHQFRKRMMNTGVK